MNHKKIIKLINVYFGWIMQFHIQLTASSPRFPPRPCSRAHDLVHSHMKRVEIALQSLVHNLIMAASFCLHKTFSCPLESSSVIYATLFLPVYSLHTSGLTIMLYHIFNYHKWGSFVPDEQHKKDVFSRNPGRRKDSSFLV